MRKYANREPWGSSALSSALVVTASLCVVVVRVGFVVVVGARCVLYVVAAVVCVGARCAPCVVAVLCAVVVVGLWWLARSGGRGDSTELTQRSFFGRHGHTTATYPCHGYGFCTGLDLATRTRTHG